MPTDTLKINNLGPIKEAKVEFGDLTIVTGPQASGKSILLQTLKLMLDTGAIQDDLTLHAYIWKGEHNAFLNHYFGDGMSQLLKDSTQVVWQNQTAKFVSKISRQSQDHDEKCFYIPAQRVITIRDGWPKPFSELSDSPYVVRKFSERLRKMMEKDYNQSENVFPIPGRLLEVIRGKISESIYRDFDIKLDKTSHKKMTLKQSNVESSQSIPFSAWSAGQREFTPLLLSAYWLLPAGRVTKRDKLEWVIVEEPEMGLHPRAITTTLIIILSLIERGYKVCVSTHSTQFLDMVWLLRTAINSDEKEEQHLRILKVLGLPTDPSTLKLAKKILTEKSYRIYYVNPTSQVVDDISDLSLDSSDLNSPIWGELLDFSGKVGDMIADIANNAKINNKKKGK